jgi:hypothetical protein
MLLRSNHMCWHTLYLSNYHKNGNQNQNRNSILLIGKLITNFYLESTEEYQVLDGKLPISKGLRLVNNQE